MKTKALQSAQPLLWDADMEHSPGLLSPVVGKTCVMLGNPFLVLEKLRNPGNGYRERPKTKRELEKPRVIPICYKMSGRCDPEAIVV